MTSSCIKAIDEGSHTIQDLFCAVNKRSPGNEVAIFHDVPRPHPTFPVRSHFEIQYSVVIFWADPKQTNRTPEQRLKALSSLVLLSASVPEAVGMDYNGFNLICLIYKTHATLSINQMEKFRTIVTWSAAFFHTSIKIVDFHIEFVFILSNVFHCFDFPLISFYFYGFTRLN